MEDSAFCLHGMAGTILSMTGTLLVSTLDCRNVGKSRDIERCLSRMVAKKGENSFASQQTYILEKHCALWIPFGFLGMIYACPSNRATLMTASELQAAKKGGRKRKKAGDEPEYASSMFIPAMSVDRDQAADPQVVTWVNAHLLQAQAGGPKQRWMDESGYGEWMKALGTVASSQNKDKKEGEDESSDSD